MGLSPARNEMKNIENSSSQIYMNWSDSQIWQQWVL